MAALKGEEHESAGKLYTERDAGERGREEGIKDVEFEKGKGLWLKREKLWDAHDEQRKPLMLENKVSSSFGQKLPFLLLSTRHPLDSLPLIIIHPDAKRER